MSPILFNIFLSDLAKKLESGKGKLKLDTKEIGALFWADDIVLLAENDNHLTEMLNIVDEYCKNNNMTINIDKTKCMVFNKNCLTFRETRYKLFSNDWATVSRKFRHNSSASEELSSNFQETLVTALAEN